MGSTQISNERQTEVPMAGSVDLKLEVVVIPVADVERAKRFYSGLGWRLDADFSSPDGIRVVQLTPPNSPCSIQFGNGLTAVAPGTIQGLLLVVSNIQAARAELSRRGVDVSEVFHYNGIRGGRVPGPDPEGRTYRSFAAFTDPDGNGWVLQEVTTRLPGRTWAAAPC